MPKVGNKHYSYDSKGMAAARRDAKRTGQKLTMTKPPKATKKR
jgi:hypothetical protein